MHKTATMKNFFLFILLALIGTGVYFAIGNYSEGFRTGVLMKMSKKGIVFKTNEGQLNIGGFDQTNDAGISNVWEFSVTADSVLMKMENAMNESQRVKLYYNEKYISLPWRGDTKYFVYDVEELGEI